MAGSSIASQLASNFFSNVLHNPVFLLSFLIPIAMLFVTSLAVRHYSKKTRIDGPPTLEQKREKFLVPRDFFNREAEKIRTDDYEYFLMPISSQFESLKQFHEYFKVLQKDYRKYVVMSQSSRKGKRLRGLEGRKRTFNEILKLYNQIRGNKFDRIEFEQEEERI